MMQSSGLPGRSPEVRTTVLSHFNVFLLWIHCFFCCFFLSLTFCAARSDLTSVTRRSLHFKQGFCCWDQIEEKNWIVYEKRREKKKKSKPISLQITHHPTPWGVYEALWFSHLEATVPFFFFHYGHMVCQKTKWNTDEIKPTPKCCCEFIMAPHTCTGLLAPRGPVELATPPAALVYNPSHKTLDSVGKRKPKNN